MSYSNTVVKDDVAPLVASVQEQIAHMAYNYVRPGFSHESLVSVGMTAAAKAARKNPSSAKFLHSRHQKGYQRKRSYLVAAAKQAMIRRCSGDPLSRTVQVRCVSLDAFHTIL